MCRGSESVNSHYICEGRQSGPDLRTWLPHVGGRQPPEVHAHHSVGIRAQLLRGTGEHRGEAQGVQATRARLVAVGSAGGVPAHAHPSGQAERIVDRGDRPVVADEGSGPRAANQE